MLSTSKECQISARSDFFLFFEVRSFLFAAVLLLKISFAQLYDFGLS